jgi:hypothetical protein
MRFPTETRSSPRLYRWDCPFDFVRGIVTSDYACSNGRGKFDPLGFRFAVGPMAAALRDRTGADRNLRQHPGKKATIIVATIIEFYKPHSFHTNAKRIPAEQCEFGLETGNCEASKRSMSCCLNQKSRRNYCWLLAKRACGCLPSTVRSVWNTSAANAKRRCGKCRRNWKRSAESAARQIESTAKDRY